jgi:hypothetical protein
MRLASPRAAVAVEAALVSKRRRSAWPLALIGSLLLGAGVAGAARDQTDATLISTPAAIALQVWQPTTDDLVPVTGHVTIGGSPVEGVRLRVGDFELASATGAQGQFTYLADATSLARHVVSVADDSQARWDGAALSPALQKTLATKSAAITVAYPVSKLRVGRDAKGDPTIAGTIGFADKHTVPPTVTLFTYQLSGTVTNAAGRPVVGALVSTRTGDRDYWTVSTATDSHGTYTSLFTASDEAGDDPVPMTVKVAIGNVVYQYLAFEFVRFTALKSAHLDVRLPPYGYALALPLPGSYPGAIYEGIVVGVSAGGSSTVRPLSATWPDAQGRFTITLPRSMAGHTVSLWEAQLQLFSIATATPGGTIDLGSWPRTLPASAARGLATVRLP